MGLAIPGLKNHHVVRFHGHGDGCCALLGDTESGERESIVSVLDPTVSGRCRPDFGRRPGPPTTPYRHASVPSVARRTRLPRVLRPGATLPAQASTPRSRNLHTLGSSPRPTPRSRFRPHLRRLPRETTADPLPGHHLGLLELSLRSGTPLRATEAILEGMVAAFEFFQAVPKEVWWDNPKTVATLILEGRERRSTPDTPALASHYVFKPLSACRSGNEKPDAESTVKTCNAGSRPRSRG